MISEHNEVMMQAIIERLIKSNPTMKIGDRMIGPVGLIKNGKDTLSEVDAQIVTAMTRKIDLPLENNTDLDVEQGELKNKYLHPYMCMVNDFPHKVGDIVKMIDPQTFAPVDTVVTQSMIDAQRSARFRFGTSDII